VVVLTVPDALNTAFFDFLKDYIVFYVNDMDMSMVVGIQMDNKRCLRVMAVTRSCSSASTPFLSASVLSIACFPCRMTS
jgi:hypothetical protein